MVKRVRDALTYARGQFWKAIVRAFPEAKSGDIDPAVSHNFDVFTQKAVENWVRWNVRDFRRSAPTANATRARRRRRR